jgi:N-acetylglutamate synthase-like GNAT family acetyltransferase
MKQGRIRRATATDAEAIRDLTRAVYAKWQPLIGREPLPMSANYEQAVANHVVDLLEDGSGLIALVEMIPHNDHLFVENLAVAETHQRQGFGSAMLLHAEKIAGELGLAEIQLATNQAFVSNTEFYIKRGYHLYDSQTMAVGGTALRFRKSVAKS